MESDDTDQLAGLPVTERQIVDAVLTLIEYSAAHDDLKTALICSILDGSEEWARRMAMN